MYLENARALTQGILLLIFAAVAYWVSLPVGLLVIAFMGIMKIQESVTGWCPSDVCYRPMGLKTRAESKS